MHRVIFLALVVAGVAAARSPLQATAPEDPNDPAYDYTFPEGFFFSTATSSYQIEGGWNASGKGENIWDRLTHEHPELIKNGANGDVACDSYHKYKEDIRLAKELGTNMYRFSLSWTRLLPKGTIDEINEDGVRYYNAVIDECIKNDITPMVTMYHWDLPQPLQDLGGWANNFIVDYFVDYADFVFKTFGDRVKHWVTVNEPWTICVEGYGTGSKSPAIKQQGRGEYLCAHNILKAHGSAYRWYDKVFRPSQKGKVGIVANSDFCFPKDPNNAEDRAAAERWMQFNWGWIGHPIYSKKGNYPQEMIDYVGAASTRQGLPESRLPKFTNDEIKMIKGSADFYGLNIYAGTLVSQLQPNADWKPPVGTRESDAGDVGLSRDPNWETTIADWVYVVPKSMSEQLIWTKNEYDNPPVIITENGYPDSGQLEDTGRVHYLRLYLLELLKAKIEHGCNVFGYTTWSLLDNFEWYNGYTQKLGLIHVDFEDPERKRTPKMSATFYKKLIATRKVPRDGDIIWPDDSSTTASPTTRAPSSTARPTNSPSSTARPTNSPSSTARPATDAPSSSSVNSGVVTFVLVAALLSLLRF